jgi:arsenate reductase
LTNNQHDVTVIDYIKSGITSEQLRHISESLGLGPQHWIRTEEPEYKIHVKGKTLTDAELFDLMIRFPKLIQRPIVLWADRAVVARPLELLIDAITDAD